MLGRFGRAGGVGWLAGGLRTRNASQHVYYNLHNHSRGVLFIDKFEFRVVNVDYERDTDQIVEFLNFN